MKEGLGPVSEAANIRFLTLSVGMANIQYAKEPRPPERKLAVPVDISNRVPSNFVKPLINASNDPNIQRKLVREAMLPEKPVQRPQNPRLDII